MFKKGQGIQFNWIFVLVAGILILSLFISFGMKYIGFSEQRDNAKISILINNQLDPLSTSSLYTELDPQGMDFINVNFYCEDFSVNDYKVSMRDKLIFAPDNITSDKLLIWIDEWKMPYKVSNFIFISSSKMKYYFVGNKELSKKLIDYMPKIHGSDRPFFNVEAVDSIDYEKINQEIFLGKLKEVKFILFTDKNIDADKINAQVKILKVNSDDENFGRVDNEYYIGRSLLFGAIFSDDNYECVLGRVMEQLVQVTEIYGTKVTKLWGEIDKEECNYALSKSSFDKVKELVNERDYPGINENAKKIEEQNKILYQKGCADVY